MGLTGKLVGQTEIKSDGDVFHEVFRARPHHISNMSPGNVQGVNLHEDLFYEIWRYRPNQISYMSPGNLQGVEIYEGEWGTVGSRMIWSYTFGGEKKVTRDIVDAVDDDKKSITWKLIYLQAKSAFMAQGGEKKVTRDIVDAVDDDKKSITWKLVEGSLLDLYKTMIATVDVDTKGEISVVTWTFEYEKLNEDVEDANALVDFHLVMTKDIEAYHLHQK
ncbi:unnamed protein product [Ilex paraguariensis]|uniref:Bet v I/Major latex protein domain-containing protein n=1 Tax=Ilex paraguariensis TaxID=185542 RepID=A0ABC8UH54_9AQUA